MVSLARSNAFKIAAAFAGAVIITTSLVFGLVYLQFYSSNVVLVRSVLQDEAQNTRDFPAEVLKTQLELRLTQDLRHLDYVGLYDPSGALIFGNVASDLKIPPDGKAHLVRTQSPKPAEAWQSENALFVSSRRQDGGTLVLGRSLVYVDQLETEMLEGFATAIIPVIVLALLAGTIVSLRASRRLKTIQEAIDRVMQGDLHVRLPARDKVDDIDSLVRAVNLMLDEIVRLLHQLKSVGDNIAHDLRAPLAVMRARLERGLAGTSETTLRSLTSQALTDLSRAMTTVTALLRISELESGLRRSAFDDVDLMAVCHDAFDLYRPLAETKGVAISLEATEPVRVTGDGDLLREALANLVDNAIKFTPPGGSVIVSCGKQGTLMSVSDTGPGVAPEERGKIIRRFYRAKATSQAPGVGLGLSMATTIIDLHGFGLRICDNMPGAVFEIVPAPVAIFDDEHTKDSGPKRVPRISERIASVRVLGS